MLIDPIYLSYGWWLTKAAGTGNFDIKALYTKGIGSQGIPTAVTIDNLTGTAKYEGKAVGYYSISGVTTGAGSFTANTKLTATFGDTDKIGGTIDNFNLKGGGSGSNWKVELNEASIDDSGVFNNDSADSSGATWYIDGNSVPGNSDKYQGSLFHKPDTGADEYPLLGVGAFYTTYGQQGKMVDSFGVNLKE